MRNIVFAMAASAVVLAAAPASAATFTRYTDRTAFEAAAGFVAKETFNSYQSDTDFSNSSIDFGTFRLVHTRNFGGDHALVDAPPLASSGTGIDGTPLVRFTVTDFSNRYADLMIDFASPITAFGGNFSSGSVGQVYFEVDGINLLGTATGDGFIGFTSDTAFSRVVIKSRPGSGFQVTMDNLTYSSAAPGVPEPASWAMMIAGFGLAGAALRARPRAKGAATA